MPYRIRAATPKDIPEIAARHREQNERDKTSYPMPQVFDEYGRLMPTIALALAIEDENGKIRQGVVFEKILEMQLFGCDSKATAYLKKDVAAICYLLRKQGYSIINCFVPKVVVIAIEKILRVVGFERDDARLAHFTLDLTKGEEREG